MFQLGQAERKISFVLHEPDNESEGSSNTTVTMQVIISFLQHQTRIQAHIDTPRRNIVTKMSIGNDAG
jgi:hypothetical protein